MTLDFKKFPVLVVDDEVDNLDAFRFTFRKSLDIVTANGGDEALAHLAAHEVAVIMTDQRMPKMTGLELLQRAKQMQPDAVGIILTAFTDVDVLIEAINQGQIYRYITKPWDSKEVRGVLAQAIERHHLVRENVRLQDQLKQYAGYLDQELHGQFNFGAIIGQSAPLRDVLEKVEQVAPTASTVLLRGETGTGKELVAHAIHINSPRESGPFVRVNCAALAPGVLESELFGHEKGAFTGAVSSRAGRFELANSGTLFLDEVGDLPMEVQIKLLRTLQEREFERVGGTHTLKVDVRVVSATNRNLEELIAAGKFREDLYYRLNVFPIHLPPLRERLADLEYLVEHFVAKFARRAQKPIKEIEPDALALMSDYTWPGNVRELENVIERAIIVARGKRLQAVDLDFGTRMRAAAITSASGAAGVAAATTASAANHVAGAGSNGNSEEEAARSLSERLLDEERREIVRAVDSSSGNIAQAARTLGINRSTLYYRLRKHGLLHLLPTKVVGDMNPPTDE